MNTATQLGNAQPMPENPLLQQAALVAPAQAPAPSAGQEGANAETPPFDAELQALLGVLTDMAPGESSPAAAAEPMPPADAVSGEQSLEQAEALLGLLVAQQQQQVQAQQTSPQAPTARAAAAGEVPATAELRAGHPASAAPQPAAETPTQAPQPLPAQPLVDAKASAPLRSETAMLSGSGDGPASLEPPPAGALVAARPLADAAVSVSAGTRNAAPEAGALAERLVRLEGNDAQRGEQMLQALRHNVQLQVQQSQQLATIRLDPPELGSLEIQVSQESGKISVQISAAQADTLRLLQQTSDRLRHELLTQQFVQVNVQVGGEGRSGQQSRQEQGGSGEALVRGNPLHDSGQASRTASRDVLATV